MTAADLRALAHPLRLRILQALNDDGPSTASELGRKLGESSGATSYHLRALHRVGMIEEAEQRNDRERWWKRSDTYRLIPNSIPPDADDRERAELKAAHAKIESVFIEDDEQALARWESIRYDVPLEWQDAVFVGGFRLWGTAEEIRSFVTTVLDLATPLRTGDRAPDARETYFTFRVLVQEEDGRGPGGD